MVEMDNLNEWNDPDYHYTNIEEGRPQWFKLWVEKYVAALDIENLDEDLTPQEKDKLFKEVGKAFINALFYFVGHDEGRWNEYRPGTRDGRILWNALKRDIDQSYRDYELRVKNGAKGGRPPKNP
jgi:hypothetical protein